MQSETRLMVTEAKLTDILLVKPALHRKRMAALSHQITRGPSFLLHWDGKPAGLTGLVFNEHLQIDELWLALATGQRGSGHARIMTLAMVKAFRALNLPGEIAVLIRDGHRPGERLAALCGFAKQLPVNGAPMTYWIFQPDTPQALAAYRERDEISAGVNGHG